MYTDGLAHYLGLTIDGLVYSELSESNVFVDYTPSTPERMVAVFTMTGGEADSKLPYDPVGLQIIARSEIGGLWALEKLAAIYHEIHGLRNKTLPDGTEVVFILATNASPFALGADENGRPQYSMDFRSEIVNRTKERP